MLSTAAIMAPERSAYCRPRRRAGAAGRARRARRRRSNALMLDPPFHGRARIKRVVRPRRVQYYYNPRINRLPAVGRVSVIKEDALNHTRLRVAINTIGTVSVWRDEAVLLFALPLIGHGIHVNMLKLDAFSG